MFSAETYRRRRQRLMQRVGQGLILLPGNVDSPINAADNSYPFRQDSSFLYFCGLEQQGLVLLLDADTGWEGLYGGRESLDSVIWSGPQASLQAQAERAGLVASAPLEDLAAQLAAARDAQRPMHSLPACRAENQLLLANLLDRPLAAVRQQASPALIRGVVALRSVKEREEIEELDAAADLGYRLHSRAMELAEPGRYEWQIAGELQALAARAGRMLSFPPIVTTRGEILHNHQRDRQLRAGDLLLIDAGVESARHYASDHTRTLPVGAAFSPRQQTLYRLVLASLDRARSLIRPGISYLEVHLAACRTLVEGLQALGLMRGAADRAVAAGAHALFMPHGLGHMLGLDVHDMEELGEDFVGYDASVRRSKQFGTSGLRLGRELREGFVLTAEPGLYFIPALIERWRQEKRHPEFINYSEVEAYGDFGGIRLEDDILVTAEGNRLLGARPIPFIRP